MFLPLKNHSLNAQQTVAPTINVAPAVIETTVKPGEEIERFVTIRVDGENSLPISVQVHPLYVNSELLDPLDTSRYDFKKHISIDNTDFIVNPGKPAKIRLKITPPEDSSGGYYAQLNVRSLYIEDTPSSPSSARVFPEVSVPILLSTNQEVINDAQIPTKNIFPWQSAPNQTRVATFELENTGNIHNLMTPQVIITRNGQEVESFTAQPFVLLPNSRKQVDISWQVPQDYGVYEASISMQLGGEGFTIDTPKERVIVMPSPLSMLIFIILICLGAYILVNKNRFIKAVKVLINPDKKIT